MSSERDINKFRIKGMLIILLLVLCMSLIPGQGVQASSKKTKAFKAYSKFLSQDTLEWGKSGNKISLKKCKFATIYLDNNSVPELLIFSNNQTTKAEGTASLYTFKNGQVTFINVMDGSDIRYYKKTGVIRDRYITGGGDRTSYWKLSGTNLTEKLGIGRPYAGSSEKDYYSRSKDLTTKSISKAKFNSKLKKMVGTKKATKVKSYKNTKAKRKKYLK